MKKIYLLILTINSFFCAQHKIENIAIIGNKTTEDVYQSFSDEYADEQDDQYLRKMRIERQVFFKSALGALNVQLSRDLLIFNLYECAREGLAKPGSDFNKEGCAVVQTTIKLLIFQTP